MTDIKEMLLALDKVTPGIASDETLLYGVEVKFYSNKVVVDSDFETSIRGLRAIGDGASVTRGLQQASASGISVARSILAKMDEFGNINRKNGESRLQPSDILAVGGFLRSQSYELKTRSLSPEKLPVKSRSTHSPGRCRDIVRNSDCIRSYRKKQRTALAVRLFHHLIIVADKQLHRVRVNQSVPLHPV